MTTTVTVDDAVDTTTIHGYDRLPEQLRAAAEQQVEILLAAGYDPDDIAVDRDDDDTWVVVGRDPDDLEESVVRTLGKTPAPTPARSRRRVYDCPSSVAGVVKHYDADPKNGLRTWNDANASLHTFSMALKFLQDKSVKLGEADGTRMLVGRRSKLATAVKRELARRDREAEKERAAEDRQRDRENAQRDKIADKMIAKAQRKGINYVRVLVDKAKVTKAASKDQWSDNRFARVVKEGRGAKAQLVLYATDSHIITRIPLEVVGTQRLKLPLVLPKEVLVDIEKTGAFRVRDGGVEAVKAIREYIGEAKLPTDGAYFGGRQVYAVKTVAPTTALHPLPVVPGGTAGVSRVMPADPPKSRRVEVTLNAKFLHNLAQAMGGDVVTLAVDLGNAPKGDRGRVLIKNPIRVESPANDATGAIMPVRRDVMGAVRR